MSIGKTSFLRFFMVGRSSELTELFQFMGSSRSSFSNSGSSSSSSDDDVDDDDDNDDDDDDDDDDDNNDFRCKDVHCSLSCFVA